MTPLRKRMIENMELHGLADRTRESYVAAVSHLARHYNRSPDRLSADEIRRFFLHLINERQAAKSTVTIHLCGIKFFFEKTLGRQMPVFDLVRPKRRKKLPAVLSTEEVRRILSLLTHPTARMALTMIYSCGLRLSEGTHLRVEDIDLDRRVVRITGKGGKDRYVPLARRPMTLLQRYRIKHPSDTWLFTGRNKERPFPNGTLQKAFKAALRQSGIHKKASIHTLRHSYATHLLEHGIDVVTIQKTLGHRYASTTTIYTHLTRTRINTLHTTVDQVMSRL